MSAPSQAVFLSYASQDAEAARRICDTLRASGVEVWFDADGGLEHGDEWDAKIRRQIKECVLFIPVISANTQAREEGYFRIEWELAAERAMGIASGVPFILPVVVDDTREPDALVPDRFRKVQWTKIPGGNIPAEVQARLLKLWSHRTGALKHEAGRGTLHASRHVAPEGGPTLSRPPMSVKATPTADRKHRGWKIAGVVAAVIAGLGVAGYNGYRWYYKQQEAAVLEALNMTPPEPVKKDGRVLVARLENRTGDAGLEMSGQLVADHVRRRLPELEWVKEAAALRDGDRPAPEATAEEMRALAKKSGGDALVTGYYYKDGGRVMFSGRIFDLKRERIFAELAPIGGEAAALAVVIEEMAERLVGVASAVPRARQGREDITRFVNFSVPRRFDALQILEQGSYEDLTRYRRSYERDPKGSLSALVLLAFRHVTDDRYAEADRVLAEVDAVGVESLPLYIREMAHWVRATAGGDSEGVEKAVETICRWMPSNRYWRTQRVLVMFRANKPRAILKEFAGVTPGSPGEKVWAVWSSRALAYFLLQDWPNMEAAAKRLRDIDPHNDAGLEAVAYAAVRRGDIAEAMRMLDAYDSVKDKGNSTVNLYVSVLAAMRQAGQAEKPEFAAVVRRADGWFASRPKKDSESKEIRTAHCEMLYLAGRYAEARQRAEKLAAEFPDDVRLRSYVATAAIRLGDLATARATAEGLRALDPRYRFGYPLFAQAKIATLLGQPDDALRLLREAFAQYTVDMKDFSWQGLLVSPDFDALRSDPRFKEFVAPRG